MNIINAEYAIIIFNIGTLLFCGLPISLVIFESRRKKAPDNTQSRHFYRFLLLLANLIAMFVGIPSLLVLIGYGGPRCD